MVVPEKGSIIEGLSDGLVYGSVGLVIGIIPFIWTVIRMQGSDTTIHPESEEAVNNTRTFLNTDNPNEGRNESEGREQEGRPNTGAQPRRRGTRTEQDITCPICLSDAQFAVETNCGHKYCGQCMITYWNHGNWLGAVRCPSCRQQVNILLSIFTDEEQRNESPEKTAIVNEINRYNRRFSGEPLSWIEYIRDLPTILRHCVREFFSVGGLIWMFRLRVLVCFFAAILYFISPFDLVPEAAFGLLGMLDDLFILLLLAIYVSIIYRRVVMERAMGNNT